jgi:ADP-dependent NAD(P)H-hydrate dehydratase / NAD(P)H-hydrate epimerase
MQCWNRKIFEEGYQMRIGTSQVMNSIDKACVEKLELPMIVMMENAALKAFSNMEIEKYERYVIVCGTGNNGGDGFAIARHLYVSGKKISVFLVTGSNKLSETCKINYNILKNMGIKVRMISNIEDVSDLKDYIIDAEVTVDSIFGTGLNRMVEGIYDAVIAVINENSRKTFSIDIPSGLNSDSGVPMGNAVRAYKTITFEMYKRGFLNYKAGKYCGEIIVEKVGIPEFIIEEFHNREFITQRTDIAKSIRKREIYNHKGEYGRVLIAAGSKGFTGAALISTEAAVKSGCGLVTLACNEEVQKSLSGRVLEAMTINFDCNEEFRRNIKISDAIAVGPGLGNNEKTLSIVKYMVEEAECPLIIDADGINVLSGKAELLKKGKGNIIITPHLGEMSRITGLSIEQIKENRLDVAKDFAQKYEVIVLLKGYQTVITDGRNTYINPTGNSAMASGGMGDCLTGIIASFAAQGINPLSAAVCGAYIHGYIGEKLSENMYSVNASHIIEKIPFYIKEILQ